MKIFAIADAHLSGAPPAKPMSLFGGHWLNHWEKIKSDWRQRVAPCDIVLIAGDISWALKFEDALFDLNEIISLPGRKILVKGNHDYWWRSLKKMSLAVNNELTFLQNNFARAGRYLICGSRGWICPSDPFFKESDFPIYQRELLRTEASLKAAQEAVKEDVSGFTIILMLHFPPFSVKGENTGFTDLIKKYNVKICVYGHLHGESAALADTGFFDGTDYHLTSCDFLNFRLKELPQEADNSNY